MHIIILIKNSFKKFYFEIFLTLFLVIIFNLFYPYSFKKIPELKKGDIAPKDIIAPFTFDVIKNKDLLKKEKENAYDNTPPLLILDEGKSVEIIKNFLEFKDLVDSVNRNIWKVDLKKRIVSDSFKNLSEDLVNLLISDQSKPVFSFVENSLKDILKKGVVGNKSVIPFGKNKVVSIKRDDGEITKGENEIFDIYEANEYVKNQIIKKYSSNSFLLRYGTELFNYFLKPNLYFDRDETFFRREKSKNEIPEKIGVVLKGEIIVRANQMVDQIVEDKIYSLNQFLMGKDDRFKKFYITMVKNLIFIISFILYLLFINTQFDRLQLKKRDKLFVSLLYILNLFVYGFFYDFKNVEYILPLILTSLYLSLLYSKTFSLITVIFIISSLILYSGMRIYGLLALMISSIYSIFFIKDESLKKNFYMIIFKISAINTLLTFFIEIYRGSEVQIIFVSTVWSFLNPVISFVLMMFTIKTIETFLNRLTSITLIELSDLNNELLKELSERAAGTYNHSILVSRLAERIAKLLGVDFLMVRVGGYYHDIGKIQSPEYFIENQFKGVNPHENLPPEISSQIIKDHVENGLVLAKKYKLPSKISRFISTHHGTTFVSYFFDKAKGEGKILNPDQFRYAGPLPSTKEETIVMLADSIEAAVRSLDVTDDENLKNIIDKIIKKRMEEDQFKDSEITLREIEKIKEISFEFFKGIYHPRIEYASKE